MGGGGVGFVYLLYFLKGLLTKSYWNSSFLCVHFTGILLIEVDMGRLDHLDQVIFGLVMIEKHILFP